VEINRNWKYQKENERIAEKKEEDNLRSAIEDDEGYSISDVRKLLENAGKVNDDCVYSFRGDLSQMSRIGRILSQAGFSIDYSDVYPGVKTKDEFKRALELLFKFKVEGWWNQRDALIENGVCTDEEYRRALSR